MHPISVFIFEHIKLSYTVSELGMLLSILTGSSPPRFQGISQVLLQKILHLEMAGTELGGLVHAKHVLLPQNRFVM